LPRSLEVEGLVVRYGQVTAVNGIDLHVEEGEIVVLLGANGAGKTSSLNAICGAVPCAAGRVTHAGRDITRKPAHRVAAGGLVQVPEGRRIFGPLTVEDNLKLGAYAARSRRRMQSRLDEIFELFPILRERRSKPGGLLSGGEQQMLAFGRALMAEPKMLLLDEPSMGLAPVVIDVVVASIAAVAARGLSILMVEQNASAAFAVASRAYVLEQGHIVLDGPTESVSNDPRVIEAFLGVEAPLDAPVVGARADD